MAKKQLERFTLTRRVVRSRGKVRSTRCRRRVMENDRAETQLDEFWNGVPLEPPDPGERKEVE